MILFVPKFVLALSKIEASVVALCWCYMRCLELCWLTWTAYQNGFNRPVYYEFGKIFGN